MVMNYSVMILEILTALLGVVMLIAGLVIPKEPNKTVGYLGIAGLIGILGISFFIDVNKSNSFINGLYVTDALAVYFKQAFLAASILVLTMSVGYKKRIHEAKGEFLALLVFALLGMMVMASANDFITLYIGLELMTITLVILTAYEKKSVKSSEAGLKYILLSAMSSGILLYGMSLLYGISGSIVFSDILDYLKNGITPITVLAAVFVIAGFGFKISMVPFHMWSPDVYEGAPTPITAFLAIGSKAAGFAALIRILFQVLPEAHQAIAPIIIALTALTMFIGNLIAIPQTNIKRLLAYSSIAHAGYILLGIVAFTKVGVSAMLYYLLLYIFANTGAFSAIIAVSNETGSDTIESLTGLWKRSPLSAWTLLISLLSLAGIPPAAGFVGKFYLFTEIIKQGYLALAFLAVGLGVVSIYYYVKVIRTMLKGTPKVAEEAASVPLSLRAVMIVSLAMTLVMGVFPGPFISWTNQVASLF